MHHFIFAFHTLYKTCCLNSCGFNNSSKLALKRRTYEWICNKVKLNGTFYPINLPMNSLSRTYRLRILVSLMITGSVTQEGDHEVKIIFRYGARRKSVKIKKVSKKKEKEKIPRDIIVDPVQRKLPSKGVKDDARGHNSRY